MEKSQAEHREVFEAALQENAAKAGKAMYNHLNTVLQDVEGVIDGGLGQTGENKS